MKLSFGSSGGGLPMSALSFIAQGVFILLLKS
jgi:hypothetical protein